MNEPDDPRRPDRPVPDPHAAQPAPPPQEGMRPEADPAVVRPDDDEPNGPIGGLFKAAGAETAAHFTHAPGAAAVAHEAGVGVEEEGLESGQLLGLMLATAIGVVFLVLTIYFLFYSPKLEETREAAADVPADRYTELREARAAALERLGAFALNEDSTYRLPIDAAMRLVAHDYAAEAAGAPTERQGGITPDPRGFVDPSYNGLTWLTITPPPAVRRADAASAGAPAAADTSAAPGVEAAPPPVTPPEAPPETP